MSGYQEINTEYLKNYLIQQIECPICYKYMSPPIRMCSKGHSTCDTCTKKYQACTKCRYPFLTTRNLALESISFEIDIPCKECKKKFNSSIFYQHNCHFNEEKFYVNQKDAKVYKCRISDVDSSYRRITCHWTGYLTDIDEHFQSNHILNRFDLNESKSFKWTLPYKQDQENISVIIYDNNIFLQEVFYEEKKKVLYFVVFDISRKNNNNYNFKILIPKKNKKVFDGSIFKKYRNIQKLKLREDILEIDIDDFDMRKDREISWILSIHKE